MRTDSGRLKRMNLVKGIEAEFDEPLAEVVIGMRQQGCSWETIAGALEISPQTLLTWRRTFGFALPDQNFKVIEKKDPINYKDALARERGYRNFNALYADFRLNRKMLVRDIAAELSVHENTLYVWVPENMKGNMYIETDARISSREKNLEKAREAKRAKYSTLWTHDL